MTDIPNARIRIGISSCLLGERVRYDGGHKRDRYIATTLARHVEFVPVCPEVAIGLGVPRPPVELVGRPGSVRARRRDDPRLDVTGKLAAYGSRMARSLADVSGYLFKARSPSCGLHAVPVHDGRRPRRGRGVYADAFLQAHPDLPAEEEGGLADSDRRDNFLERVIAYHDWQSLVAGGVTAARLEQFHVAHRLSLMAHSARAVSELGGIVTRAGRGQARAAADAYLAGFMRALARPATMARHHNVLQYALGYLERELDRDEKATLLAAMERRRRGSMTQKAMLALMRRHFRRHPHAYLARQTYFFPDARERALRGL